MHWNGSSWTSVTVGDLSISSGWASGPGDVWFGGGRQVGAKGIQQAALVHWNGTEKTWDCPCHGSRFDAMGHVMNGPSVADLAPVKANGAPS